MPNGVAGAVDRVAQQFFLAVVQFTAQVVVGPAALGLPRNAGAAVEQASPTLVVEVAQVEVRVLRARRT